MIKHFLGLLPHMSDRFKMNVLILENVIQTEILHISSLLAILRMRTAPPFLVFLFDESECGMRTKIVWESKWEIKCYSF